MSDERSKISLRSGPKRKGRPTISAPKQISGPIAQNDGPGAAESAPRPRLRPAPVAGSKTSNLVKQRYSTRFHNLPTNFDVPPPPPVPSLPSATKDRRLLPPARVGAAPVVEKEALWDPNLVPDQFVSAVLGDASEDQIHDFQESLRRMKDRAAVDLDKVLVQNHSQFIKIGKEAGNLKDEMQALRSLMADLKTNTDTLRAASNRGGGGDGSARRPLGLSNRDKRSSVADRSALWNSQMQTLFKSVEGAQKFLPHAAGRHVVEDAGHWVELDNATYKSVRAMQLFLLNDHLLVASRKKRKADAPSADARGSPPRKLVADRCWPLLDIEVVDMPGAGGEARGGREKLADAIMVRGGGQGSFIYRTDKPGDPQKRTLLASLRKQVEELRKGLLQRTELLEAPSDDIRDMPIEVDGQPQKLRWAEGQANELDVEIALQRFEPAVALVERLKGLARSLRSESAAQDYVNSRVDERSARLAGVLLRELQTTHNQQLKTRQNVGWLARLGFEDAAREAYLAARSDMIRKRARQCIFKGDLHLYIWELSFVYFTLIHNTVQCFQGCFPSPMMSTCVRWAKEQVEAFNAVLARQLSSTERGGPVWTQCMERAREHGRRLSQVGLHFEGLVGRGLEDGGAGAGGGSLAEMPPVGLGLASGGE